MKVLLTIEKDKGKLWGRVTYKNNLITDYAGSISALEKKMTKLLSDFHGVQKISFDHSYDLTVFFEKFDFLKQSKVAELAGINPGLLRQYASGVKNPSADQARKIEKAVHQLAKELQSVSLYAA
ncbi:MAG TPA: helix-turn-helix transcriptional regulator [Chitinophagaceae bacterium]|nr:helix-turn-helix transcriptional regulator [Chitinophagaceae bacterium]